MNNEKCGNCRFWCETLDDENDRRWIGECRRYPPTQKQDGEVLSAASGHIYMRTSSFEIITHRENWCGEYGKLYECLPPKD